MTGKEAKFNIIYKTAAILIASVLILNSSINPVIAETDTSYKLEADKLNALGLFKGTDIGYELDRSPNRAEAGVMLVRLLGKESEALSEDYPHPFTDVPEWADRFMGYMWKNRLTKGVGDDLYAPYEPVDARSYLTFLLRALGYSDDSGDFTWEGAVGFSYDIGLISGREYEELSESDFTRGLMVALSYNAMNSRIKGKETTLTANLAVVGSIDESIARDLNFSFNLPEWEKYLRYLEAGYFKPYVVGLDMETALIRLRKSGAENIEVEYAYDELVSEGDVLSQDFTAYVDTVEGYDCTIEVSLGPTLLYHEQLMNIAESKGWDERVIPYIISGVKYLIKETVLTRYDVFRKLRENINELVILGDEDSVKMSFAAVYDGYSGNMYINGFILDEELILHEITHALSQSKLSGKIGFSITGTNSRRITEAFTHYTAERPNGDEAGQLLSFSTGTETITFSGGMYFSEGDNNFVLGVFAPLFTLAGRQTIETMFFHDVSRYGREILEFNSRYGVQRFETLWSLADMLLTEKDNLSAGERSELAKVYKDYLNQILECLYIDLDIAGDSENSLIVLRNKVYDIKMQFPLAYNDYRNEFLNLENEIASRLEEYRPGQIIQRQGYWSVPDLTGIDSLKVHNILTIIGDAVGIGYEVISSDIDTGSTAGVILKSEDGSSQFLEGGEQVELGGIYIIQIPMNPNVPVEYSLMRNFTEDFSRYLADYSDISSYIVAKVLQSEGFTFRYEFIYFDDASPQMNGRIVGQFPEPDTAVIPGRTTVIIKLIRKR